MSGEIRILGKLSAEQTEYIDGEDEPKSCEVTSMKCGSGQP